MPNLNKEYRSGDQEAQNTNLVSASSYSRRSFLKRVAALGVAGLVVPGLLIACGSGNTSDSRASGQTSTGCEGGENLSAQDKATRQALNYVDQSPHDGKMCANCRFFKQPAQSSACGGCEIVGGPIKLQGYCNSWAAQS